ncbi:MAG TPA: hypothetical protein PLR76_02220 [Hyphomonas sp.]|nr:hypothetical protein [Hyphomonas sp.]MCA8904078.1 hypothetical protein [Hyphomonas sp.]MCB9961171.1 hypothetical protein [Hyphomonas sp.]MCB9970462.1 hypothetical protein [Hyphomonas sp.]HPE47176.1 hypothetical protein [Hyphomonas sp.]
MAQLKLFAAAALAASLAACQSIPQQQTVAEYCATSNHQSEAVCKLQVEIDGQSVALKDTDMRLSQARSVADDASAAAAKAQAAAEEARQLASAAMSRANEAASKAGDVVCETRTIQNSKIGTCRPGYKLTSCTQTRYTYRAGGPSIMREINDQQCRFQDKVLEMQVRCCGSSASAPAPEDQLIKGTPAPATTETQPETSSLNY